MSSNAMLTLGTLHLGSSRNEIDPRIMALFQYSDKQVEIADQTRSEWLKKYGDEFQDEEPFVVRYVCSAQVARDRLDLLGFTRQVAEAGFRQGLLEQVARYEGLVERSPDLFKQWLEMLRQLSVQEWMGGIQQIRDQRLMPSSFHEPRAADTSPLLDYMLRSPGDDWYGFPGFEYRHMIRLVLDICPDSDDLVYDLTDLVLGGWFDEEDDLVAYTNEVLSSDLIATHRIVLTEGAIDKQFLERSLALLYPHLKDYFHFLDFKGYRVEGGAGALANMVKAFAAAGIMNRVIALFDNDTAAEAALRPLSSISLPKNIVIRQYPDIPLAESYPTIGPNGVASMNVNGLAGSIELYLGADVLRDEAGNLTPIQWRGYERGLDRYQGEILSKSDIQARFDHKLKTCEADESAIPSFDWDGVRAILGAMTTAFHEKDAADIMDDYALLSN